MRKIQPVIKGIARCGSPLLVLAAILTTACGGGGGGGSNRPVASSDTNAIPAPATALSGAGVKGPLAWALVKAFSLDLSAPELYNPAAPIATVRTNSNGQFQNLRLPAGTTFPIVLIVDGTGAVDLNTGVEPSITTLINVITDEMARSGRGIYATPLTTLAFKMARQLPSAKRSNADFIRELENAADAVQDTLGFGMNPQIDILRDPPLLNEFAATHEDRQAVVEHRAALEAVAAIVGLVAQIDAGNPAISDVTLDKFAADLSYEGTLNDRAASGPLGYEATLASITNAAALTIPNTNISIAQIDQVVTSETTLTGETRPDDSENLQVTLSATQYDSQSGLSTGNQGSTQTIASTTTTNNTYTNTYTHINTQTNTNTYTYTYTHTDTQTNTNTQTDTQTYTNTDTETDTETETEWVRESESESESDD